MIGSAAGLTKTDWDLQGTSDPHTLQPKTLKCDCTWITPARTEMPHAKNTGDIHRAINSLFLKVQQNCLASSYKVEVDKDNK